MRQVRCIAVGNVGVIKTVVAQGDKDDKRNPKRPGSYKAIENGDRQ